ncbi:PUA-like domain-containing protein [Xylaria grammica]|nr:PUA-like domain-containing protein [Xylaria grammica]
MNQILSPTIRHFNLDGSSSPSFSRRSPSPRDQSSESLTSEESVEPNWNQTKLLDLSDSIREGLRGGNIFGPDAEKLSSFLEAALKDEERKYPTLDFDMIEYARLDKLLAELLQFGETMKTSGLTPELLLRFRVDVSEAKNLRRSWRRRFREQFFMMDQHRCAILIQGGLKDVSFNSSLDYDLGKWQTKKATNLVSEIEGNLEFEPGHWWLNITCAERDGIVNSSLETPTKGCYGFTALPLLSGSEELIHPDTVKYVREGRTSDMHIALISQVGRKIRILRGHKLKSILAPEAGLRYDGLYTIRQYGFKLDNNTNKYRLELTLERATDQRPFESICNVPKPSQLDDWALYEKLEGDKVKLLQGEASYLEWKLKRQEEKVDREEWQRATLFRASFSLSGAADPGERLDRRVTFRP